MINKRVTNVIAIIVTSVWALSFVADILMTTYEPSPYLHAIMMTVAGSAFAGSMIKKDKDL